jgi:hypothetical protein
MKLLQRRSKFKRGKKRMILFIPILIIFVVLLFFFSLIFHFQDLYLYFLNPEAGAAKYEREYRVNFDKLKTREKQINMINSETVSQPESAKTYRDYQNKAAVIFGQINLIYKQMLLIDDGVSKLSLRAEFKQFYKMRKDADILGFNAIQTYREKTEQYMMGLLLFYGYNSYLNELREIAFNMTLKGGLTDDNFRKYDQALANLDIQAQGMQKQGEKGLILPEVTEFALYNLETMNIAKQVNLLMKGNDRKKTDELAASLLKRKKIDSWDVTGLQKKQKKEIFDFILGLDSMHGKSSSLYNQAYIYAKTNNLKPILSTWNGNFPVVIKDKEE